MLREDGKLAPTTRFEPLLPDPLRSRENAAERAKDYVRRHWKYQEPAVRTADLVQIARSYSFCISGMAFQDAWNIDLQRLRRCCVHVVTLSGKLIPFCAYYLTGASGQRLADARLR